MQDSIIYIELMSKPESVKVEPWADFPKQSYSLFHDDFVHEKPATFKFNAKGSKSSASIKVSVNDQKETFALQEEVRLWWALKNDRTLFTKIKSHDYLKVHFDNGITERWGINWNLYGSINTNKSLENLSIRLGAHSLASRYNSDNRIKIDYADGPSHPPNLTWYNRTVFNEGKFTWGTLTAIGVTRKVLAKNNIFLGYRLNDQSQFFLRAENEGYRKDPFSWAAFAQRPHHIFDNIKLDFVSSYQDYIKYGVQTIFGTKGKLLRETLFVVEHLHKEWKWTSKLRLSSNLDITFATKFPAVIFKDIATTSFGVHLSNFLAKERNIRYGLQVEFNI